MVFRMIYVKDSLLPIPGFQTTQKLKANGRCVFIFQVFSTKAPELTLNNLPKKGRNMFSYIYIYRISIIPSRELTCPVLKVARAREVILVADHCSIGDLKNCTPVLGFRISHGNLWNTWTCAICGCTSPAVPSCRREVAEEFLAGFCQRKKLEILSKDVPGSRSMVSKCQGNTWEYFQYIIVIGGFKYFLECSSRKLGKMNPI